MHTTCTCECICICFLFARAATLLTLCALGPKLASSTDFTCSLLCFFLFSISLSLFLLFEWILYMCGPYTYSLAGIRVFVDRTSATEGNGHLLHTHAQEYVIIIIFSVVQCVAVPQIWPQREKTRKKKRRVRMSVSPVVVAAADADADAHCYCLCGVWVWNMIYDMWYVLL